MTQSYAPGPTPFSNYGISNAAGPPHGLSEEQGYSAFLAPSDHNSNLADRDANSPFTSPSDGSHSHSAFVPNASASMSSNPTNFAFTGPGHQPAASLSTTNLASAGHGHRPAASVSTMLTSAPGSSIASGENVSPPQPSVHTGILPSNKLLREAQRYASAPTNRSAASGSSALGDDDLLPPHYSE
ncbi:hypothetical protein B0H19DRAFT_425785 [Mycena capillaripes]|nr:hypothetical protein B0H19DRAFT_425785 [Mycena capillaripes]